MIMIFFPNDSYKPQLKKKSRSAKRFMKALQELLLEIIIGDRHL